MEAQSEFRGLILDVLELIADRDAQLEYQQKVPYVDVAGELFEQWDDAYHPTHPPFVSQFSGREFVALEAFASLIDRVANETPRQLPPLAEFMKSEHWKRLSNAARVALTNMDQTRRNGLIPPGYPAK